MRAVAAFEELLSGRLAGEALQRMARYAELLETWSERHNLVRFSGRKELVERHLLDALEGARLLTGRGRLVDVGSGAGLPGVPLLIARPAWWGTLVEPRQKRWAFLKLVIRELGLEAEALCERYQQIPSDDRFDLVTARAVGDHRGLIRWAGGHLAEGGAVALWTTVDGEREIDGLPGWRVLSWPLVGLDRGRLVSVRKCST